MTNLHEDNQFRDLLDYDLDELNVLADEADDLELKAQLLAVIDIKQENDRAEAET